MLFLIVLANAISSDQSMSGGDKIFIECVKRWSQEKSITVSVFTSDVGQKLCVNNGLKNITYVSWSSTKLRTLGIPIFYLIGTIKASVLILRLVLNVRNSLYANKLIVFSSSDFWPDSIPALIAKIMSKKAKWVAAFYLFAPNPFKHESPYKGKRFIRGLIYYFSQVPIYWLVKKYSDMVWVTSELDKWKFMGSKKLTSDKVIAIHWGVDTKLSSLIPEPKEKKFDAVFIGRFHPQKGILELIDAWNLICKKKFNAKLAIIGVGDLENEVKRKIKKYDLEKNIFLFGFKDGVEKIEIFKKSKIVVHPAVYDTGSIAPMEAMSCGLPAVMFDLPAFKTYYPKGVLKVPLSRWDLFAESIVNLLSDTKLYEDLRKEALELSKENDWDKRAKELLEVIKSLSC